MAEHPITGERILRRIPQLARSRRSSATSTSTGTALGYPDGLKRRARSRSVRAQPRRRRLPRDDHGRGPTAPRSGQDEAIAELRAGCRLAVRPGGRRGAARPPRPGTYPLREGRSGRGGGAAAAGASPSWSASPCTSAAPCGTRSCIASGLQSGLPLCGLRVVPTRLLSRLARPHAPVAPPRVRAPAPRSGR